MCTLPNFQAHDLSELEKNRKKVAKKAEAKTVEIIISEQPLVKNSI